MALRSFGEVLVAAGGTPARATANEPVPGTRVALQSILVQARPENAGKIYIFNGGSNFTGDHRTTRIGILAILPAPSDPTTGGFPAASFGLPAMAAGINAADIWVDAESSGDGVIVSGTVG